MAIEAYSIISCETAPTEDSHLANKKYVDEAVAASGGGGGGGSSDSLVNGEGTYTARMPVTPPYLTQSNPAETYLVPQESIAAGYSASVSYSSGDFCVRNGRLYRRNGNIGSAGEPSLVSLYWDAVSVADMVRSVAGCGKSVYTQSPGFGGIFSMADNPEVIIFQTGAVKTSTGLMPQNYTPSAYMEIECHFPVAEDKYPDVLNWNNHIATWIKGSIDDLKSAGTHIVKLRIMNSGSTVYAEYIGKY